MPTIATYTPDIMDSSGIAAVVRRSRPVATPSTEPVPRAAIDRADALDLIAEHAAQALITELLLTPKPGLVDMRNSGAHHDMNMQTFLMSTRAVAEWFPRFVEIGHESARIPASAVLPVLRVAGVRCEKAMFDATGGINTHKGAIFSLGLLCAAASRVLGMGTELNRERICAEVASVCVGLVDRELNGTQIARTAGERMFKLYGLSGARGEAVSGFETVRTVALPLYDHLRSESVCEDLALLQVLLQLLAVNNDTNLVSRGGLAGLQYVHHHARKLLREGGVLVPGGLRKMAAFDDKLIACHLSPGGTADLLAVTWFLAQFPTAAALWQP
jgi:triphosphoribosyl-dephospho-CoA synthase